MRLTVVGGCGAWPGPGQACGGYLVEHVGFRLLVDPGYAVVPRLPVDAAAIDAVFVSHGHPDHCADLNPLLRARAFRPDPAPPLPVYALPGAVDAVLALDRPGLLTGAHVLREFAAGAIVDIGPFRARTRPLPHSVPNAGVRLDAGGPVLAYTGDSGSGADIVELARDADVLVADASYVDETEVPPDVGSNLNTAAAAGRQARAAGAGRLVLTHLIPRTDPAAARAAASTHYGGDVTVAAPGLVVDIGSD